MAEPQANNDNPTKAVSENTKPRWQDMSEIERCQKALEELFTNKPSELFANKVSGDNFQSIDFAPATLCDNPTFNITLVACQDHDYQWRSICLNRPPMFELLRELADKGPSYKITLQDVTFSFFDSIELAKIDGHDEDERRREAVYEKAPHEHTYQAGDSVKN